MLILINENVLKSCFVFKCSSFRETIDTYVLEFVLEWQGRVYPFQVIPFHIGGGEGLYCDLKSRELLQD